MATPRGQFDSPGGQAQNQARSLERHMTEKPTLTALDVPHALQKMFNSRQFQWSHQGASRVRLWQVCKPHWLQSIPFSRG